MILNAWKALIYYSAGSTLTQLILVVFYRICTFGLSIVRLITVTNKQWLGFMVGNVKVKKEGLDVKTEMGLLRDFPIPHAS